MTAALIYLLLLSLIVAEARRDDEGGRCTAVQQRLVKLRAEIEQVEQEAEACSDGVTLDAPHSPAPPLEEAAAGSAWAGEFALPVNQSAHDVASTTSEGVSEGRRRQTSSTAPPSSPSPAQPLFFASHVRPARSSSEMSPRRFSFHPFRQYRHLIA